MTVKEKFAILEQKWMVWRDIAEKCSSEKDIKELTEKYVSVAIKEYVAYLQKELYQINVKF